MSVDICIAKKDQGENIEIRSFLNDKGVEFFTFNPNPDQNIRFVLRGLPNNTDSDEVVARLKEKGVEISNARQIKRWSLFCNAPPAMVLRTQENIIKLKILMGILNSLIRIQDYKTTKKIIRCFRCQGFGHKAEKCVKCAGDHPSHTSAKVLDQAATCVNCNGQHSVITFNRAKLFP